VSSSVPAASDRSRLTSYLRFLLLTAILGYAVLYLSTPIAQSDRATREDQNLFVLGMGVLGLFLASLSVRRQSRAQSPDHRAEWLALALLCYIAFQLLPLPVSVLRVLSPARADLIEALAPLGLRSSFFPLSVAPSLSLVHFLLFGAYVVVFFLVRQFTRSSKDNPWLTTLPILGIAAWQGAWGVQQFVSGGDQSFAHGTYPVKNHFAGMLEMSLPLAVAFGVVALQKGDSNRPLSTSAAVRAAIGFSAAALMLGGILSSLSRMGMVSCIGSLLVMGILALSIKRGKKRWPILVASGLAVVLALASFAPAQLVVRFSEISTEGRLDVGKETLRLIAAYPLFGTGLGGYQSAFEKFKTTGFALAQDYAHNDYLQFFAELGLVGFLIGGAFLFLVLTKSVRSGIGNRDLDRRWLGLACSGALAAILIHSVADFNLYVPANAMLLAWICGIAAGGLVDSPE